MTVLLIAFQMTLLGLYGSGLWVVSIGICLAGLGYQCWKMVTEERQVKLAQQRIAALDAEPL